MISKRSTQRGFTLIELMVAVAVFSVVMLIAVGSLLTLVDANRKAHAIKSVMNNLNFALESMVRNARVGTSYHCDTDTSPNPNIATPTDCASGGVLFAFETSNGDSDDPADQQVYRFVNDDGDGRIERSDDSGATFVRVTSPEVRIESMTFYVVGASKADRLQPQMIVTVRGFAGVTEKLRTEFSLQAVSSQRVFDL